jgi:hypothetical protein
MLRRQLSVGHHRRPPDEGVPRAKRNEKRQKSEQVKSVPQVTDLWQMQHTPSLSESLLSKVGGWDNKLQVCTVQQARALPPSELRCTLSELRCTLRVTLHPLS